MTNIDHSRIDAQWKRLWSKLRESEFGLTCLVFASFIILWVFGRIFSPYHVSSAWEILFVVLSFIVSRGVAKELISERRARQKAQEEARKAEDYIKTLQDEDLEDAKRFGEERVDSGQN